MSKKEKKPSQENNNQAQNKPKKNVATKIIGIFFAVVMVALLLVGGYYALYNPDELARGKYYLDEDGVQNGKVWMEISRSKVWKDSSGNSGRYILSEDKTVVTFKTTENGSEFDLFQADVTSTEDEDSISVTAGVETFKYILAPLEEVEETEETYLDNNPLFAQKYTVTFNPNGGTGTGLEDQQVIKGRYIVLPELSRGQDEYLSSWKDAEGNVVNAFTRVLSDLNLTAEWAKEVNIAYNLNYVADGNTEPEIVNTTSVKGRAAYIPERAGYVFTGWWYSADLKEAVRETVLTEDVTLYAEWAIDNGLENQIKPPVVEIDNGVFKWESAEGANKYVIKVYRKGDFNEGDDEDKKVPLITDEVGSPSKAGTILTWTFPASKLGAGEYEVKLMAVSLNGTGYNDSSVIIKLIVK